MATLLERILNRPRMSQIAEQFQQIQQINSDLAVRNDLLQQQLMIQFRSAGGIARGSFVNNIDFVRNGYQLSSAVYSIVSDIAQKAAGIPLKAYHVKDDKALSKLKILSKSGRTPQNIYSALKLRTKALEEVPEGDALQMLIDNPNPDYDTDTFYQTMTGYRLLCGNSYVHIPKIDMGANVGRVTQLNLLPAPYVLLIVVQGFPAHVIGYELVMAGVTLFKSGEVCHMRYPNYDATVDGQQLYGMSPLRAGTKTLRRSNDYETAAIAQVENGGPAVIIANKSIASDETGIEQVGKIKKLWQSEFSGATNKAKVKFMAGDISAIPLGITPVEMDLIAGEHWTFDMICNLYHTSSVMFNNHEGNTESNVKEMRRDSYTRAIIPERKAHCDMFNRNIAPGFNSKGVKYFVDMDLSGIPELQPDMKTQSEWMSMSWWVSPNEKREMQDFGKSPDENMNKIWMPQGLVTMDDMSLTADDIPEDDYTPEEIEPEDPKKKDFNPGEARDDRGRWTDGSGGFLTEGEAFEAQKKLLGIPPAWKNVKISKNTEADLLATGQDMKGRTQYIYSENATMRNAAVKFSRNEDLLKKQGYIVRQNEDNMLSLDRGISEPAHVMSVIHSTGIRPGSLKETGAKVKAYGATTLEGRHVVDTPEGVRLQFVGKKGVDIDIPVTDHRVANMLLARKKIAGADGRLFDAADNDLRLYTKKLNGGGFTPKDFRTLKGTQTAMDEIVTLRRATNDAEYKKFMKQVAGKVSKVLGNTPAIALKSYINPFVWLNLKPL